MVEWGVVAEGELSNGVSGESLSSRHRLIASDPTRSLASMSPNPSNSNEVVAGGNGLMLANTSTGQIVRRVSHG